MNADYLKSTAWIAKYVREILVIERDGASMPFILQLFANGTPTLLFQTEKGQLKNNTNFLTLFGQTISPTNLR
jgi:hypothetical protein